MRIVIHSEAGLLDQLARESDALILSPVETSLEISARVAQADVIIVDVASLGAPGLQEIRELRFDRPVLAIVTPSQAAEALGTQAKGVLLQGTTTAKVEAALQALHVGLRVTDPAIPTGVATAPKGEGSVHANGTVLTPREREVIVLMAEGLSNKQIAAKLTISEHTAKFHVNSILQKMDAQKRVEAVVRAAQQGLLSL